MVGRERDRLPLRHGASDGVDRQHHEVDGRQPLRVRLGGPAQVRDQRVGARPDRPLAFLAHLLRSNHAAPQACHRQRSAPRVQSTT